MALSAHWLDELRARTTLSTLVGRTVPMKRAGNEWRGCCPFHEEKTPSFYVNDAKAFYHCFGCGAHGDAIGWMIDQRGLAFIDAVKELAGEAGMEMPAPDPRSQEREERRAGLHDVTQAAARWFSARLAASEGTAARAYLAARGVAAEQVAAFAIGYAPDRRDAIAGALPFRPEQLTEAGLLVEAEGRANYDRFRDRLVIPIHDARARVIGFGGRTLSDGTPKYLNSPETPLFDKGRTLFNLHRAAPAARSAGRVLVVEGYLDVIALAGVGIDEAVAPLGTALTEAQLELLWRHADVPVLCFDGDAAGERAAVRAAERALPLLKGGRSLAFVTLPPGQDPDDLVRGSGRGALDALVEGAEPLADRLYRAARGSTPPASPEAKAAVRARLDALAATITDRELARDYGRALRDRLFQEGRAQWQGASARGPRSPRHRPTATPPSGSARALAAGPGGSGLTRAVLAGLVLRPTLLPDLAEPLSRLELAPGPLAELRDALVRAAHSAGQLDLGALHPICATAGVDPGGDRRAGVGLAFSWLAADGGEQSAHQLTAAVHAMADLPRDERALASVTAELGAETGSGPDEADRFADLFAWQAALRDRIARARDELNELAWGDDGLSATKG